MISDLSALPWNDPIFAIWSRRAAAAIARALATEIDASDGSLIFGGHPKIRLLQPRSDVTNALGPDGFRGLQAAARWVYENDRETETRHRLLALEMARVPPGTKDVGSVFAAGIDQALEGARLTFQLGLEDVSRDSLKILSDLQKGLGDEAAKLADSTRQLTASVAGAIVLGLGLLAAKMGTATPRPLILVLAGVVTAYIALVIFNSIQFIFLQRSIRKEWRGRLYRFLTADDYEKMVSSPVRKAEFSAFSAMTIGGILALAMLAAIALAPDIPPQPAPSSTPAPPQQPVPAPILPAPHSNQKP